MIMVKSRSGRFNAGNFQRQTFMDPIEKCFPCPACGFQRDSVSEPCRDCGWRQRLAAEQPSRTTAEESPTLMMSNRPCLRCGSLRFRQGIVKGATFVDSEEDHQFFPNVQEIRCRCCSVCGHLDLSVLPNVS